MNTEEYKALSNQLRSMDDVRRLAREKGYEEDLLLVIYTQRVTRNATKNFYKIKAKVRYLVRDWESGKTLLSLAIKHRFPPVLLAYIIMMERKIGRKTFWKYVRKPDSIANKRLKREIKEIVRKDHIYSPRGNEIQVGAGCLVDQQKIRCVLYAQGTHMPDMPMQVFANIVENPAGRPHDRRLLLTPESIE